MMNKFVCCVAAMQACLALDAAGAKRPNILFAIADDMSHASAYGHNWVSTPNFDKLAKEGVLFPFLLWTKCNLLFDVTPYSYIELIILEK